MSGRPLLPLAASTSPTPIKRNPTQSLHTFFEEVHYGISNYCRSRLDIPLDFLLFCLLKGFVKGVLLRNYEGIIGFG